MALSLGFIRDSLARTPRYWTCAALPQIRQPAYANQDGKKKMDR